MRLMPALMLALSTAAASAQPKLPAEVLAFIDRRNGCDHFRGEPWDRGDDPETKVRREFVFQQIKTLCTGTDRQLAGLRKKYARNKGVIEKLADYEDVIEKN